MEHNVPSEPATESPKEIEGKQPESLNYKVVEPSIGESIVPESDVSSASPSPPPETQEQATTAQPLHNGIGNGNSAAEDLTPSITAGNQQQKESVFVRLSNRIKTLEKNQSMTAAYLEELSQRFKKQNEDNIIISEAHRKHLNDTRVKSKQMEVFLTQEVNSLRRNVEDIRERLFNVQLQRSLLILLCFLQSFLIVCGFVWIKRRLQPLHSSGFTFQMRNPNNTSSLQSNANSQVSLGRKRSNSVAMIDGYGRAEKRKKVKKKKKPVSTSCTGSLSNLESAAKMEDRSPKTKGNIDPHKIQRSLATSISSDPVVRTFERSSSFSGEGNSFQSVIPKPFSLTPIASNYCDSSSSRFAILASPEPEYISASELRANLVRSGSESASSVASVNSVSGIVQPKSANGFPRFNEPGSRYGSKKGNKRGIKALMPKLFDR